MKWAPKGLDLKKTCMMNNIELTDINHIKELLGRNGFRFSKSMGQNFLTESWVPRRIAEESGTDKDTGVLEIGPGIGCLTAALSERAGKVLSLELDRGLEPVLEETMSGRDNVEIMFCDAMKQNIPELVREKLPGFSRHKACANLPYNITTPVLTMLIQAGCFETITVMVQKEVAERICASAGSREYGAFSVFIQWYAKPELLFDVPAGCFIPRPKVNSAVLHLEIRKNPPAEVSDEKFFFKIVRAAFNQRRKTLVNAVAAGLCIDKNLIENAIKQCKLDIMARGETLSIEKFAVVTEVLRGIILANDKKIS